MDLLAFEKAKERADEIQSKIEGEKINNPLGTNSVNTPGDEDYMQDYNKGVEIMGNMDNYQILNENGEYKTGTFRPKVEPEEEKGYVSPVVAPEVEQERAETSQKGQISDEELKRMTKKAGNLHIELPQYGRALYIKKNHPEKLADFLKKHSHTYRGITPEMI
jgi:molecular chaperone DnaK (HSP70)